MPATYILYIQEGWCIHSIKGYAHPPNDVILTSSPAHLACLVCMQLLCAPAYHSVFHSPHWYRGASSSCVPHSAPTDKCSNAFVVNMGCRYANSHSMHMQTICFYIPSTSSQPSGQHLKSIVPDTTNLHIYELSHRHANNGMVAITSHSQ